MRVVADTSVFNYLLLSDAPVADPVGRIITPPVVLEVELPTATLASTVRA